MFFYFSIRSIQEETFNQIFCFSSFLILTIIKCTIGVTHTISIDNFFLAFVFQILFIDIDECCAYFCHNRDVVERSVSSFIFIIPFIFAFFFHEWQVENRLDESKEQREE